MTRTQALEIARANHRAHAAADIANLFRGAAKPNDADFGHRNGWYLVGAFNFSTDEITGVQYDFTQAGFAYL